MFGAFLLGRRFETLLRGIFSWFLELGAVCRGAEGAETRRGRLMKGLAGVMGF
jgi:hypothetical protein